MDKSISFLLRSFPQSEPGGKSFGSDRITVDYYGQKTALNAVATISTPDPRSLLIQPWDASILKEIEKSIQASDLGINPTNDGKSIRLVSHS